MSLDDAARVKRERHPEQNRARDAVHGHRTRLLALDDAELHQGGDRPWRSLTHELLQLVMAGRSRTVIGPRLVETLAETEAAPQQPGVLTVPNVNKTRPVVFQACEARSRRWPFAGSASARCVGYAACCDDCQQGGAP
jgi:hypothetical protein